MNELMQKILLKIERMTDEQFDAKLDSARNGQIASFVRDMEDMARAWSFSLYFEDDFSYSQSDNHSTHVWWSGDWEMYTNPCAANDERFALAA